MRKLGKKTFEKLQTINCWMYYNCLKIRIIWYTEINHQNQRFIIQEARIVFVKKANCYKIFQMSGLIWFPGESWTYKLDLELNKIGWTNRILTLKTYVKQLRSLINFQKQPFFKIGGLKSFAIFTTGVSFNKVAGLKVWNFIKRGSNTSVFMWILRNLKKQLFYRTPLVAASKFYSFQNCF